VVDLFSLNLRVGLVWLGLDPLIHSNPFERELGLHLFSN
jgi:hypothetical protein